VVNWIDSAGSCSVADSETTEELAGRIRACRIEAAHERLPEAGIYYDLLIASPESVGWHAIAQRVRGAA